MRFFRSPALPAVALSLGLMATLAQPAAAAPASVPAAPHVAQAPMAPAALPATGYYKPFSAHGKSSSYHIYTDGIDRSKPVGVTFYFGGDYWRTSESSVHDPGGAKLKALAAEARKKNMVLVVPVSPDKNAHGDGITWWEDIDVNGQYFRALQSSLVRNYGLDTSRVWLVGYSGGAEFITYEVLAHQQNWIRGGGATVIGGGGSGGMRSAPAAAVRGMPVTWHAGTADVEGNTNPPTWSASAAATKGQKGYKAAGFTRTKLSKLQGVDHYGYNAPALLRQDLAALPDVGSSGAVPGGNGSGHQSPLLKGAIKVDYLNTGGAAKYGHPTSAERPTGVGGGVYQPFSKGWTYYWSPRTPAAPVKWGTAIGSAYAGAGYERGWGYPLHAERQVAGGAYQDFRLGSTVRRVMWSPTTGTHVIKLTGGMGTAWKAAGYERAWGFPTTDEYPVRQGYQQRFSKGYVATWDRKTGRVSVARG